MTGGGTQNVQQTSTTQLTDQQKELIDLAMPGLKNFASNPPQLPGYSRVAGFDPAQTQGQQQVLNSVPAQQEIASGAATATNFLTNPNIVDPNSNPGLQGAINAAVRPIQEQLTTSTLPAIRGEAIANGQYGGSRQGIAEGLAAGKASSAIGDATANIVSEGYKAGLDALARGASIAPQSIGAQSLPGLTTSGVGDVRQNLAQQQLSESASDYNYNQVLPYLVGSDLVSLAGGTPGGSTVSTATGPGQSFLSSALGGLTLGSTIGPALGLTGAAGGGIGAGLAALLSFL